ncbi:PA2779 family protein [Halomonas sp. 18H]|uniref:PA2779 family protein n=1 Tax=Halomonas almeriensis TaxID=308163 RepID=UPI00222F439C|nr:MULTISPECIES: PA2779 family protein [Halomonas]MCW4151110.1 PA2779 family protein [Halomonas sp. 18H]MDN3552990.1 PA2779 family protein [Halomonas almeriensis]
MKRLSRLISPLLIAALVLGSLPAVAATSQNELVGTAEALDARTLKDDRQRIHDVLAREDVQRQLALQGVDADEVESRLAALSDAEVSEMAERLDQMPAGASVVGALFAAFVILLVTDILGLTDVYPFTR